MSYRKEVAQQKKQIPLARMDASWWFFMGSLEDEDGCSWKLSFIVFAPHKPHMESRSSRIFGRSGMIHAFASLLETQTFVHQSFERRVDETSFSGDALDGYRMHVGNWVSDEREGEIELSLPLGSKIFHVVMRPEKALTMIARDKHTTAYIYSRLSVSGYIEHGRRRVRIQSGVAWYERARSCNTPYNFAAFEYEWVFLLLNNKTEVVLFRAPWQYFPEGVGVCIDQDGGTAAILAEAVEWRVTKNAQLRTGVSYPVEWYIGERDHSFEFIINAYTAEQECDGRLGIPLRFWFGSGRVQGTWHGLPVSGEAFMGVGRTQRFVTRLVLQIGNLWYKFLKQK